MSDKVISAMDAASTSILLVGPGDCSQSVAILQSGHTNVTTAIFDSEHEVKQKYRNSEANIAELMKSATGSPKAVLFDVDATLLGEGPGPLGSECEVKFDVILWYFPHSGLPNSLAGPSNKLLISRFLQAAPRLLAVDGDIQVAVKTSQPYSSWNLGAIMRDVTSHGLTVEAINNVDKITFPGYVHRTTLGAEGSCLHSQPVDDRSGAVLYVLGRDISKTSTCCTRKNEDHKPNIFMLVSLNEPLTDEMVESDIIANLRAIDETGFTAKGYGPSDAVNVLDIRARFSEHAKPDTRQMNRVIYDLKKRGIVTEGPPRPCNMKPTWSLLN